MKFQVGAQNEGILFLLSLTALKKIINEDAIDV